MPIAIVGIGYVGLVSAACFADLGVEVYCVDVDEAKIQRHSLYQVRRFLWSLGHNSMRTHHSQYTICSFQYR